MDSHWGLGVDGVLNDWLLEVDWLLLNWLVNDLRNLSSGLLFLPATLALSVILVAGNGFHGLLSGLERLKEVVVSTHQEGQGKLDEFASLASELTMLSVLSILAVLSMEFMRTVLFLFMLAKINWFWFLLLNWLFYVNL